MTEGNVRPDTGGPSRSMTYTSRGLAQLFIRWLPAILIIAGAVGLWEGVVAVRDIPNWKLPAPSGIGEELWDSRGLLLDHTWVTLKEALVGFGIALGGGIVSPDSSSCRGRWNGLSTHWSSAPRPFPGL